MNKKRFKQVLFLALILLAGWKSVYFQPLDEKKAALEDKTFDAAAYAQSLWENQFPEVILQAPSIDLLITQLQSQPEETFDTYSNALGIGNIRFFMTQGKGRILQIGDNDLLVRVDVEENYRNVRIATEYIFGNALRDASGLVDIGEFVNTMDFNQVSAELNSIVRKNVIPSLLASVKKGDSIAFSGAMELNREFFDLNDLEIIPAQVSVIAKSID